MDPAKRWMALAQYSGGAWRVSVEPVGDVAALLDRLRARAAGAAVALGADVPLGLPRAYAALHAGAARDFPTFLRALPPDFLRVCDTLAELGPGRPFYPRRGLAGMTRQSHALALGLPGAASLSRLCDRATAERPAGAPPFWTLGANQSGKAAASAWGEALRPALAGPAPPALWPFQGRLLPLLARSRVVVAETYPAEALRQLGLRLPGSKRRQADRAALGPALRAAMGGLDAAPDPALHAWIADGFGANAAGEDRLDCVLGLLCVLQVLAGRRTDTAPDDPWVQRWEGWVLGQTALPRAALPYAGLPCPG